MKSLRAWSSDEIIWRNTTTPACVLRMTCCNDGLMGDHLAISGGGAFTGPLNSLKTDVSRGPPGLSGGTSPLGPHRNSPTACAARRSSVASADCTSNGSSPGGSPSDYQPDGWRRLPRHVPGSANTGDKSAAGCRGCAEHRQWSEQVSDATTASWSNCSPSDWVMSCEMAGSGDCSPGRGVFPPLLGLGPSLSRPALFTLPLWGVRQMSSLLDFTNKLVYVQSAAISRQPSSIDADCND